MLKLALALQAEVAEGSFDYVSMHLTSWSMHEGIRKALDGNLRELFGPEYPKDTSWLPLVVGYIFMPRRARRSGPARSHWISCRWRYYR